MFARSALTSGIKTMGDWVFLGIIALIFLGGGIGSYVENAAVGFIVFGGGLVGLVVLGMFLEKFGG